MSKSLNISLQSDIASSIGSSVIRIYWCGASGAFALAVVLLSMLQVSVTSPCIAQDSVPDNLQIGAGVPPDVEQITSKALGYLTSSQNARGTWEDGYDSHATGRENCGLAGMGVMAMLSTGEDPNSGPYASNIRAALRYIIATQNPETGFLPNTMYNHGFAMLALAEAYGTIDDSLLWQDASDVPADRRRSIGESLHLAVDLAVKSQDQNPAHAWRYHPTSKDADSSVSGAVFVGLLAARNAGVAVPDTNIAQAADYFEQMTNKKTGTTLYDSNFVAISSGSNLSAITALTLAISQNHESPASQAAQSRIKKFVDQQDKTFPFYNMYYMAQALFQTDYRQWKRWNNLTVRRLRRRQSPDGSFDSNHGKPYGTAMACLALALNYRFLPIYER